MSGELIKSLASKLLFVVKLTYRTIGADGSLNIRCRALRTKVVVADSPHSVSSILLAHKYISFGTIRIRNDKEYSLRFKHHILTVSTDRWQSTCVS